MNKLYRVEIVEISTGKVVSIIGKGLSEERAEKRETMGLMRIDRDNFFVRTIEEKQGE